MESHEKKFNDTKEWKKRQKKRKIMQNNNKNERKGRTIAVLTEEMERGKRNKRIKDRSPAKVTDHETEVTEGKH